LRKKFSRTTSGKVKQLDIVLLKTKKAGGVRPSGSKNKKGDLEFKGKRLRRYYLLCSDTRGHLTMETKGGGIQILGVLKISLVI